MYNIVFIVLAAVGALLVAIPLPKALASGNVGTSMLVIWTEFACLVQLANAIRWNGNINNWAPAWCDFCGYFFIVVDIALVACSLSINRRLYLIVTLDPRREEKFFNMVVDIIICVVMPWASISLQYVVQQYRFYIYEDIGCIPGVGAVNLAFPLVWMLPLFLGILSTGYACFTIRANLRWNHISVGEAGMSLTWSQRLMGLAVVSAMYGVIPTSMAMILLATAYPVTPWPGWTAIHSTIHVVIHVPALEWRSTLTRVASAELRRWTTVTLAFMIFVLLGLTTDVKKMYWEAFKSVIGSVGHASSSRSIFEKNADGNVNDQKAPRSSQSESRFSRNYFPSYGISHSESRESVDLTSDMSMLEPGFQLVLPASRLGPDAMRTTDPSWKV